MWRSKAKLLLLRASTRSSPFAIKSYWRNQVLSKTIRPPSFSFSSNVNRISFDHHNPRFFSQQQDTTVSLPEFSEGPIDELVDDDKNPSFFSQGSHISETRNPGIDTGDRDEQSPGLFSQELQDSSMFLESGNGDDRIEETLVEPELDMEQVQNVLSVLQSSLTGPLESTLDDLNVTVTEKFLLAVIETPHVLGEILLGFFRWAWKKSDSSITIRVVELLVQTISSNRRTKDGYFLWDLVRDIGERDKSLLNTGILNELISLFWKLGKGKAGLEVFGKSQEFGCKPDSDTYYFTIRAACTRSMFDEAWSVCEQMLNSGSLPESEQIGELIACFCRGSKAKDAHLIFLMAKENKKYPPSSSVNFLIGSLCRDDATVCIALEILEDLTGERRKYAIKPFSSVVRGLCRIMDLEGAKKLLFKMIELGPPPGNTVFNYVITGLSKEGKPEEAIELMKLMGTRGLRPDVYAYSVVMSGFVKCDRIEEAFKLFSEAKKVHSKLTPVTYHILIRTYCKLEKFEKALELLHEMKENGVRPNADEYTKMIQSLCLKALDWRTSEELLKEMTENGLYLNKITGSLIRAVKELEEEMFKLEGVAVES